MLLFSTGALLLHLVWVCGLVTAEVGTTFHKCKQFFYKDTPPKFQNQEGYKHICQFYQGEYRFATLYNTGHRAPFYSAYRTSFSDDPHEPRGDNWMYEPQLANEPEKAMQPLQLHPPPAVSASQAVLDDFRGTLYEQGHLNPNQHHATQEFRDATFTLTNIVPQRGDSNRRWANTEESMGARFRTYCNGVAYVITGGMPYKELKWLNEDEKKVSIPEYVWSAYCCQNFRELTRDEKVFIPTYAAVVKNDLNPDVKEMSVEDLEKILQNSTGIHKITLFHNHCN